MHRRPGAAMGNEWWAMCGQCAGNGRAMVSNDVQWGRGKGSMYKRVRETVQKVGGMRDGAMEERENNCCGEYSCVEEVAAASSTPSISPSTHGAPPR